MDPVLVEITRGNRVESAHVGAAAVVDASGAVVFSVGDIDRAIFPRSAVKSMQALPMVETGAAARLGLTEAEIALACSSHNGEEIHVATATSMLAKAGRDVTCLECGTHWPSHDASTRALAAAGKTPSALHNNCSGKHSGFICLSCDQGIDPKGYIQPDHKAMRQITAALSEMTGTVLDARNRGIDGCSIPTFAIPLRGIAHGFARYGTGNGMAPDRARAAATIRAAVTANPMMVAGTGRFDTLMIGAMGARVFCKGGAEGVFCASLPELGYGIAVKCDDGAGRAAQVAGAALVARLLRPEGAAGEAVAKLARPTLKNWNGIVVGEMRPAVALG
jgi:L-asparaginase II